MGTPPPTKDFRARLHQTPGLAAVVSLLVVIETALFHVVLHAHHPWAAWIMTASSLSLLVWIWGRRSSQTGGQ